MSGIARSLADDMAGSFADNAASIAGPVSTNSVQVVATTPVNQQNNSLFGSDSLLTFDAAAWSSSEFDLAIPQLVSHLISS